MAWQILPYWGITNGGILDPQIQKEDSNLAKKTLKKQGKQKVENIKQNEYSNIIGKIVLYAAYFFTGAFIFYGAREIGKYIITKISDYKTEYYWADPGLQSKISMDDEEENEEYPDVEELMKKMSFVDTADSEDIMEISKIMATPFNPVGQKMWKIPELENQIRCSITD